MKNYKIEVKWAFIFAAMYLLWMLVERLAGFHSTRIAQQQFVSMLILIPSILIYVLESLDKKKNHFNGTMSYKQSFISGTVFTLFIVILSPINQLIITYIISPEYFPNAIDYTVKNGILTPEQAHQQFNNANFIITSVIAGMITGLIFTAIISIFTKTNKKEIL